jgi:threonine aldolase
MIFFNLADDVKLSVQEIIDQMKARGVLVDWAGPRRFRLVTHYWVTDEGVEKAIRAFNEVMGKR